MASHYHRKKTGKTFVYYKGEAKITDQKIIERLNALMVPPAWTDVEIAMSPTAKIQATGKDKAGRVQAIYSPAFRAKQEAKKFARILEFAKQLPAMRRQIEKDLARHTLTKAKVLACIVKLMDEAYFRVGNEQYAREHQTYGITTLRRKHTDIHAATVSFDFIGKSGKRHTKTITDRQIARIMKRLDELPGYEVFQYVDETGNIHAITSNDVNTYIKEHMGSKFTAKDFRTWGGTLIATTNLALTKHASSERERKKAVTKCIKKVSRQLGNTPSIARSSYVDPRIIDMYLRSDILSTFADTVSHMKPRKYLKPEEACTLQLLREYK